MDLIDFYRILLKLFYNLLATFQELSKCYLSVLMAELFLHLTIPALPVWFVNLNLNFYDSEFVILLSGLSLQCFLKLPDVLA